MSEQQYALVHDGELVKDAKGNPVISGPHSETPEGFAEIYPADSQWVPIVSVDSKPFDISRHIRETPPTYRVKSKVVERVYQIRAFR